MSRQDEHARKVAYVEAELAKPEVKDDGSRYDLLRELRAQLQRGPK